MELQERKARSFTGIFYLFKGFNDIWSRCSKIYRQYYCKLPLLKVDLHEINCSVCDGVLYVHTIIMAAMRSKCGHYIFALWFLSFYLSIFPSFFLVAYVQNVKQ